MESCTLNPPIEYDKYGRVIDSANDTYPRNAIIKNFPSIKFNGSMRLIGALWYLKINRIDELLDMYKDLAQDLKFHDLIKIKRNIDRVDFFVTDECQQNIFHKLFSKNTGANLCYNQNKELYEKIIWLLIKKLPKFAVETMFKQKSCFGRTPLEEALNSKLYYLQNNIINYFHENKIFIGN